MYGYKKILSTKRRIAIAIAQAFATYLASRYILIKGREKSSKVCEPSDDNLQIGRLGSLASMSD
jgi:hypothetical protein